MSERLSHPLTLLARFRTPYFTLALSAAITCAAALYVARSTENKRQEHFENQVTSALELLHNRVDAYIHSLRATAALFEASRDVDFDEFNTYVASLELQQHYPGIQGIGFSKRLAPEQVQAFEGSARSAFDPSFRVWPTHRRDEYHTIVYLHPRDERNLAAIGYDMFSNPIRRQAMIRARDTGKPAATGKVTLVQEIDEEKQAGFLIYVPIYRPGVELDSIEQRRSALMGFVYCPFRADDLLQSIFARERNLHLDFTVYDNLAVESAALMHNSAGPRAGLRYADSKLASRHIIEIAGQPWTVIFTPQPGFDVASPSQRWHYVLIGGLFVSLLLFTFTRNDVRARLAAERAAAELRQSQELLRGSETKFRELLESAPDAMFITDGQGRITLVNTQAEVLVGCKHGELVGSNISELVPDIGQHVHSAVTRARSHSGSVSATTFESFGRRRDQSRFPAEISLSPLETPDGVLVTIVIRDLTDRKRAEALERERIALKQAITALEQVLGVVGHELRTPLAAMRAMAELVLEGDADDVNQTLTTMHEEVVRMAAIVNDLLEVARLNSGTAKWNWGTIDLAKLCTSIIESVRPLVRDGDVRFICDVAPDLQMLGDNDAVHRLVLNLVTNACKYTPKGTIAVSGRSAQRHGQAWIELNVRDTGQGMPPETAARLGEAFALNAGVVGANHIRGTGLGLAICRGIVAAHGGYIVVESARQVGTTVTVMLRADLKEAQQQREPHIISRVVPSALSSH